MAAHHKGIQLDRDIFSCSLCLDLLKLPVSLTCGHNFCMDCIKQHWDGNEEHTHMKEHLDENKAGNELSCPQCKQTFAPRPVLLTNNMLAVVVDELKKNLAQFAPVEDFCYAGGDDVACDVCFGRKMKALKSCLVCVASFCEKHLQPHFDSPAFKKHKLVEPCKKSMCPRHDEEMKIFCKTDQECVCHLCVMEEHEGHDTVTAAQERSEKEKEMEVILKKINEGIREREKDVEVLKKEVEAIDGSANEAVEQSEKTFAELIGSIHKRRSELEQQLRSKQETEVRRVKELRGKLEEEIFDLKRREADLKQLAHTEDHTKFLQSYTSMLTVSEATSSIDLHPRSQFEVLREHLSLTEDENQILETSSSPSPPNQSTSSFKIRQLGYFEDVKEVLPTVGDKLQVAVTQAFTEVSWSVFDTEVLLSQPQPRSRFSFLRYSRNFTLDPSTAHTQLLLSEGNRKVRRQGKGKEEWPRLDETTDFFQVLSAESLTGRCYWDVKVSGQNYSVAVAYKDKDISNAAGQWKEESEFGRNDKSWALKTSSSGFTFLSNNVETPVSCPRGCARIGVYLDHFAGTLSFYSVDENKDKTMTTTTLHRVQTSFTQPLYAGFGLGMGSGMFSRALGADVEVCKLK